MENKIVLDPEIILNKEFKVDFKGYSLAEVDHFLDLVMQDYISFGKIIDDLDEEMKRLKTKNETLKQQKRDLKEKIEVLEAKQAEMPDKVTNVDLLRRISSLEKAVFKK